MDTHEIQLGMPLAAAFLLGALHVLEPAHGRSLVSAIAVGATNKRSGVLLYGLIVTLSHIAGTMVLALLALWLGNYFSTGSAVLVIRLLASVATVYLAYRMLRHAGKHEKCGCALHEAPKQPSPASPVGLGIVGGLIPCYGSLALVVAAVGGGQFAATVPLVLAFGLGLGVTLVVSGLLTRSVAARLASGRSGVLAYSGYVAGAMVMAAGLLGFGWTIFDAVAGHPLG